MKYILSLFTFFLVLIHAYSQDNPALAVSNIPSELLQNVNAVVRYDIGEFYVKSPGEATATYKYAVTRLNKKAAFDELTIYHDLGIRIGKIKIRLYDKFGKFIRKIDKQEINDHSAFDGFSLFSDARYYKVDLRYAQYPYTIEYEFEEYHSGLTAYPPWAVHGATKTSVEGMKYTISIPSGINLKYKTENIEIEPQISETAERRIYTWMAKKLKPIKIEPYAPHSKTMGSYILTTVDNFKVEGYEGSMQDWEAYGKFMYELNRNHNNLSPEMKAKVKTMTEGVETDAEKIDILYKYVQKNMRYVSVQLGIGGWRAFDAEYVEKNKYGDCKALTWFMNSMLEEAGIESYPALVRAGEEYCAYSHPQDFSYPSFNHVILNIPSEEMWLECTDNLFPTGYQSDFTDDRTVLLIKEEGGMLTRTPKIPIEENFEKTISEVNLLKTGAAIVSAEMIYSGPKHETIRRMGANYSKEEIEKWVLKSSSLPSFSIMELKTELAETDPEAILKYEVEVRKYASKAGTRLFLPINCINTFENPLPNTKERNLPIHIKRGYLEEDQLTLNLPKGFHVESIPNETLTIESEYGTYMMNVEKEAEKLTYKRKLKIFPVELPAEQYNELRDFYKKVEKADKMKIVLVSKT